MKKNIFSLAVILTSTAVFAQQQKEEQTPLNKLEQQTQALEYAVSNLQKLKVSGYIQTQYQWGEDAASLKVGSRNENPKEPFNRMGVRRGRVKFAYEEGLTSSVFQIDMTEKGIGFKDVYLQIKDPWVGTISFKAGIFDRPFGYEISYSSSRRESPERSTVYQTLFPDERDMGASFTLQPSKISPWHFLKLEAGLFAGNGIKQETDSKKDFIGHLTANDNFRSNGKWSIGVSYYNGRVYQGTENVYSMKGNALVLISDDSNIGKFSKREYFGADAQLSLKSVVGLTQLRGEYLLGTQPGVRGGSKSPNSSTLLSTDTYIRNFSGGYVMLIQDLGRLPLSAVAKYDWYNPNTKVSDKEIGQKGTDKGDIAYYTLGLGFLWQANNNIRIQAYYDIVKNETTENLADFSSDIKDDLFTLRLQYKF